MSQHPQDAQPLILTTDTRSSKNDLPFGSILHEFLQVPVWHPQRHNGIALLQYLITNQVGLTKRITEDIHESFEHDPTWVHLERDIHNASTKQTGNIIGCSTGTLSQHLDINHVTATFRAVDTGNLGGMTPTQIYSINSVIPTAKGLLACNPYRHQNREDIGIPPSGKVDGSFTYTPRGHLTDIHQDSLYQGQFTTCLLGRKLFLIWPPTDKNLTIYAETHGTGYLELGTLHAVLSLDSSATFAYDVVFSTMLDDVLRLARWELTLAASFRTHGDPARAGAEIINEYHDGVQIWTKLRDTVFILDHTQSKIDKLAALHDTLRAERLICCISPSPLRAQRAYML
ncbi:hypothetical protein OC845_006750 [Tilletia horrida]|nr:hypothetical protein OC845_006750 [Tilletia horrida]